MYRLTCMFFFLFLFFFFFFPFFSFFFFFSPPLRRNEPSASLPSLIDALLQRAVVHPRAHTACNAFLDSFRTTYAFVCWRENDAIEVTSTCDRIVCRGQRSLRISSDVYRFFQLLFFFFFCNRDTIPSNRPAGTASYQPVEIRHKILHEVTKHVNPFEN